jgi:hypothetical protein
MGQGDKNMFLDDGQMAGAPAEDTAPDEIDDLDDETDDEDDEGDEATPEA